MGIENRDDVTATYVLIHGAGADSWCWHRVRPLLETAGHTVITPDLPVSDDTAGLPEYVDTVRRAVGSREHVTVVAHSFGGFVGPIAAEQLGADLLVLLHAMVPKPGEAPASGGARPAMNRRVDATTNCTARRQAMSSSGRTTHPRCSPPKPCDAGSRKASPRSPSRGPWTTGRERPPVSSSAEGTDSSPPSSSRR
ncbi:alpha/beta fold hydrolase [Prescottella defluvii]|nr:alpha/beta fold hydrolase [Prescottella defluvii]